MDRRTSQRRIRFLPAATALLLVLAAALLPAGGCSQPDVAPLRRAALAGTDPDPAPGTFGGRIVFCRRVGRKSGRRLGVADRFVESDERKNRYVRAFVDLHDVPVGPVHQVHLLWVGPDGKELFRKYARVTVRPDSAGFRTMVEWRDAEDLTWRRPEPPVTGARPDVTLTSRLNMSPERHRPEGTYTLKVYWNRELMLQRTFTFARPRN